MVWRAGIARPGHGPARNEARSKMLLISVNAAAQHESLTDVLADFLAARLA